MSLILSVCPDCIAPRDLQGMDPAIGWRDIVDFSRYQILYTSEHNRMIAAKKVVSDIQKA